jgi:hypothetical protein
MQPTIMSRPITMPVTEQLYEARLQLTAITEYGVSLNDVLSGQIELPPQGARFDLAFQGELRGERLTGTIKGVDFGLVRADGRFDLNIQAEITTDDGEKIAFSADGIFTAPDAQTGIGQVRENVRLTTASSKYAWVNPLQIWATGGSNISTGQLQIRAYVA